MKTESEILIDLFKDSKLTESELFKFAQTSSDVDILFEIVNENKEFLNKTTFDIVINADTCTKKSIFILEKIISIDSNLYLIDEFFLFKMLQMRSPDYKRNKPGGERYMIRCSEIQAFELFVTNKIIDNFDYFLNNLITPVIKNYSNNDNYIVTKYLKNIILQKLHTDKTITNPLDLLELYNSKRPPRNRFKEDNPDVRYDYEVSLVHRILRCTVLLIFVCFIALYLFCMLCKAFK
jgi:hypothetical protein